MTRATLEDSTAGLGQTLRAGCPLVGGLSFHNVSGRCVSSLAHGLPDGIQAQVMRRAADAGLALLLCGVGHLPVTRASMWMQRGPDRKHCKNNIDATAPVACSRRSDENGTDGTSKMYEFSPENCSLQTGSLRRWPETTWSSFSERVQGVVCSAVGTQSWLSDILGCGTNFQLLEDTHKTRKSVEVRTYHVLRWTSLRGSCQLQFTVDSVWVRECDLQHVPPKVVRLAGFAEHHCHSHVASFISHLRVLDLLSQ